MTPLVSNSLKGLAIVLLCGGALGAKDLTSKAKSELNHQNEIYTTNQKRAQYTKQQAKQVVKDLPNTFETIKQKAKQVELSQKIIAGTTNTNDTKYQNALVTMHQYVVNNDTTPMWMANKNWSLTPVYDGAGSDGHYKVAFYLKTANQVPAGLITTDYNNGKFHVLTQYYTGIGEKQIATATAKQYAAGDHKAN